MDVKRLYDIPSWKWPVQAGAMIYAAISDRGTPRSERLLALELAGDPAVINDRMAGALIAILRDAVEDAEVREQAVMSLGPGLEIAYLDDLDLVDDLPGEMADVERFSGISTSLLVWIQEDLSRLYRDAAMPEPVRHRILETSVRAPWDWHINAVNAAYHSSDKEWRLTAVFCMGYLAGFEAQLAEALHNPDPDIALEAVSAAVNHGMADALPRFGEILSAPPPDKETLLRAIDLVPEIWPEEADELLGYLVNAPDREIAAAALNALVLAETMLELADDDEE
ncbi:MAG: hypothetical protein ACLFPD_04600 [Desulfosudaceae bacterium]